MAALALTGNAIAPAIGNTVERNPPPFRRRLAQHQRSAGRGIDLHPVMALDDLDIKIRIQRRRDLFRQRGEEIDPERHIPRPDNRRMATGSSESLYLFGGKPRCANHMRAAVFYQFTFQ